MSPGLLRPLGLRPSPGGAVLLPAAGIPKHPSLHRPFLALAFIPALLGGALGAFLILRSQLALGPVRPVWIQAHGELQLFGWLLPFSIGCALYLVPRIAAGHPIRAPRLARAALWSLLGSAGFLLGSLAFDVRWPLFVAGPLSLAGTAGAAWALHGPLASHRLSAGRLRGNEVFLELALAFLALSGLANAVALVQAGLAPEGLAPGPWFAGTVRLVLEGFATGLVLGVASRTFPGFLGIEPERAQPPRWVLGVWAGSLLLGVLGDLAAVLALQAVAAILFAVAATVLAARIGLGPIRGRAAAIDKTRDPVFPWGARISQGLLVIAAIGRASGLVAELLGQPVSGLWDDAFRHLLVLGFLMTSIATMVGRLSPGLLGRPLALPWLRVGACLAFPVAALARTLEGVAGQWGPPWLLWISAASGPLAAAAFAALAASVVATVVDRDQGRLGAGAVGSLP